MAEYAAFLDRNAHLVDRVPSILERYTDAAHVCGRIQLTPIAREMRREICHVHGTSDHSVHVTLSPADCTQAPGAPLSPHYLSPALMMKFG
jgi:hypothetical protein